MKTLVYGAGNIGSLYAARLGDAGQDVSILARGGRHADICEHGITLEDAIDGKRSTTAVNAVTRLDVDDRYDLVLVALPKNHVSEALPMLAANRQTPNILFFGNNAAGPDEMTRALGADRVLLGFPGAAAIRRDGRIHYLILSAREQPTTIGELDGGRSTRLRAIERTFRAAGFAVAVCSNMDAWLKTHVAEIVATAGALYMSGVDTGRLARSRDALTLMLGAIREGYRVLSANGVPITPARHRLFRWLPKPLLLLAMRKMIESDTARIKIGHALAARAEMKTIADEFRLLAERVSVSTPAMDRLYRYLDAPAPPGSTP